MKIQQIALVCLLALSNGIGAAQVLHHPDSIYTFTDPHMQKKYPWRAAAETVGMNVGVWAFDRYVMNEDFAKSVSTVSVVISNTALCGTMTSSLPICLHTLITVISTSTLPAATD